jgi:hypothetical protein
MFRKALFLGLLSLIALIHRPSRAEAQTSYSVWVTACPTKWRLESVVNTAAQAQKSAAQARSRYPGSHVEIVGNKGYTRRAPTTNPCSGNGNGGGGNGGGGNGGNGGGTGTQYVSKNVFIVYYWYNSGWREYTKCPCYSNAQSNADYLQRYYRLQTRIETKRYTWAPNNPPRDLPFNFNPSYGWSCSDGSN